MGKTWCNESEDWYPRNVEDSCLGCGEVHYRHSSVPGVCVACLYSDDDSDVKADVETYY